MLKHVLLCLSLPALGLCHLSSLIYYSQDGSNNRSFLHDGEIHVGNVLEVTCDT